MENKKFKILVYNNMYVDESLLHKGIYSKSVPTLYDNDKTIQSLKNVYTDLSKGFLNSLETQIENYISNLEKCTLVDCLITI